ncbi:hypothetical protein SAY87_015999 [Trapa incisa]|nr:hypothetical protein SAY87_015999 [Trapa incisa]
MFYLDEKHSGSSSDASTISCDSHKSASPPPEAPESAAPVDSDAFRKVPRPCGSKYRGVVPQPNGRWGAQIYENNQRIWLGTYDKEDEAAKAYNIAVQRFRGQAAATMNFFGVEVAMDDKDSDVEAKFLSSHSKAEIVEMLRTHTYSEELQRIKHSGGSMACPAGPSCKVLFQKMLTPSDVGRQNRLVIPKKHAEKHFPAQIRSGVQFPTGKSSDGKTTGAVRTRGGNMLNFRDVNGGRVWRFRFSYWNRSRSYVLTRGWSRFVKEKKLQAGDLISFQQSMGPDRRLYIDYSKPMITRTRNPPPAAAVRLFGFDIVVGGADSASCSSTYSTSERALNE